MLRIHLAVLLLLSTATLLKADDTEEDDSKDILSEEDYDVADGNANDTLVIRYCVENHFHDVIRACSIISETSGGAIVTCAQELDIVLPCFLLAIMEQGDWEKCSEIEDERRTWKYFVQQVVDKCMVKCVWMKMGFMNEAGEMQEGPHIAFLNTHFFNKNGKGSDMTDGDKAKLKECMDAPLAYQPFHYVNQPNPNDREPGCEVAEHSMVCSLKAVHTFVMNCILEECYIHHERHLASKTKRSVQRFLLESLRPFE